MLRRRYLVGSVGKIDGVAASRIVPGKRQRRDGVHEIVCRRIDVQRRKRNGNGHVFSYFVWSAAVLPACPACAGRRRRAAALKLKALLNKLSGSAKTLVMSKPVAQGGVFGALRPFRLT